MRRTGWILATAMIAGCVGQAGGGQPGYVGSGEGSTLGQPNYASLSGEACCSPNGYAGSSPIHSSCCCNSNPCCNNAWDGYCEHKARVQAWVSRIGAKPQWCPCVPRRASSIVPPCVEYSAPTAQPTPAVAPVKRLPTVRPMPAVGPTQTLPSEPPAPPAEASEKAYQPLKH
jgi:hypothetical protein